MARYNATYEKINNTAGSERQDFIKTVMYKNGAAIQQAYLATYRREGKGEPAHALTPIHLTGEPAYWVPRSVLASDTPWWTAARQSPHGGGDGQVGGGEFDDQHEGVVADGLDGLAVVLPGGAASTAGVILVSVVLHHRLLLRLARTVP
ncbi:hypothetical protein [Streptomyces sp. NPDC000405]|uniref:hypothetical protein n=1 Tax=Streptomyces sp. NPDC000405 TaxID=3161033 RepID=UPI00398C84C5